MSRTITIMVLIFSLIISLTSIFSQGFSFEVHPIDLNFPDITYIKVIDIDKDSDLDIVGGSEHTPYPTSRGLAYWRNDGGTR